MVLRRVYVLKQNPEYVVKIEVHIDSKSFINVKEYHNWEWNKEYEPLSKYMAPCHFINERGNFLIQTMLTRTSTKIVDYPKQIPDFFTDRKIQNYGWIGDQFVCCDYPHFLTGTIKLANARWWNLHAKKRK